jgi:hypothetical protein
VPLGRESGIIAGATLTTGGFSTSYRFLDILIGGELAGLSCHLHEGLMNGMFPYSSYKRNHIIHAGKIQWRDTAHVHLSGSKGR